jgi:hypothetical protein
MPKTRRDAIKVLAFETDETVVFTAADWTEE